MFRRGGFSGRRWEARCQLACGFAAAVEADAPASPHNRRAGATGKCFAQGDLASQIIMPQRDTTWHTGARFLRWGEQIPQSPSLS